MILAKNFNFANKNLYQNLKQVYGIGTNKVKEICHLLGFQQNFKKLKNNQIFKLLELLDKQNNFLDTNLAKKQKNNIEFLLKVKNTRGIRNKQGLPSRGQRSKTNSRTKRKLKHG